MCVGTCPLVRRRTNSIVMERSLLTELPAGLLRLTTPSGAVLAMDPSMLRNSQVLRKLASCDGTAILSEEATQHACERATLLPRGPTELLEWLDALDYLCAEPPAELFLAAIGRAFHTLLARRAAPEPDWDAAVEITRREFLAAALRGAELAAQERGVSGSSPPRGHKRVLPWREESTSPPATEDLPEVLHAAEKALTATIGFEAKAASAMWRHARRQIRCALLGAADSLHGALGVCRFAGRLARVLSQAQLRWLVHRAVMALHAAERRCEPCYLGLDEVRELQRAYKARHLDLSTLLPLRSKTRRQLMQSSGLFLLPCCPGHALTPLVPKEAQWLRRRCELRVPWLAALWDKGAQQGRSFFLTGSTLTVALFPSSAMHAQPADVDLFVTQASSLADAAAELSESVRALHEGVVLAETLLTPSKYRFTVAASGHRAEVDLYTHPLARIHRYHMSSVRAAFDGQRLFCSMSCATSLATSVSTCFDMVHRPERAAAVLLRKWRAGAGLLVNLPELHAFVDFASKAESLLPQQTSALARILGSDWASASSLLALELRCSEASQGVCVDYEEWRVASPRRV